MGGPRSTAVIDMAVGKDTHVSKTPLNDPAENEASRRLAEALEPATIDALLADAKAAGTPIDGADGLLSCGRVIAAALDTARPGIEAPRRSAARGWAPASGL